MFINSSYTQLEKVSIKDVQFRFFKKTQEIFGCAIMQKRVYWFVMIAPINLLIHSDFMKTQIESSSNLFYIEKIVHSKQAMSFQQKNAVILPNFLVWKLCEKAQFPYSFWWITRNYAETVLFHKIPTPAN